MGVNIALDGPSGAGKSTIAKMLSEKMGSMSIPVSFTGRSRCICCAAR